MMTLTPSVYDTVAYKITNLLFEKALTEFELEGELLSLYSISSENIRDLLVQMKKLNIVLFNQDNKWTLTEKSILLVENNDTRLPTLLSSFQFGEIPSLNFPEEVLPSYKHNNNNSDNKLYLLKNEVEEKIVEYNNSLKSYIKELLLTTNPFRLEEIVIEVLVKSGEGEFGIGTPKTHDGGIDGYIYDTLLKRGGMPIQTKQHAEHRYVTAKEIHSFLSICRSKGARNGYYVTTSYFSDTAKTTARLELCLIGGEKLVNLIINSKIGLLGQSGGLLTVDEEYFTRPPQPSGVKFQISTD
ncbi:restriction endonuclease [Sutcliffiella horikoshii]|uniref:Restriction endonuclease type IV Mrr domain-containing protein n=1 Tax=Sutcliffiella horikoshii TaxID=79883 RepID=A0A5D4T7V6_9BACI|nr:restriction endonuclease [Sutcliffiella horikoshii]TYS71740.1 hypothetical protein FZC75_11295 [Sutcliffiella horikoshii]